MSNQQDKTIRKILVTSALPYANGSLHLGHAVEYFQTDAWCRAMRLQGHQVTYVCADDQHGTPIMLAAEKLQIPPEALVEKMKTEHYGDFQKLHITFDNYGETHCSENQNLCNRVYRASKENGFIITRHEEQLYDPQSGRFLADRYVKGQCPKCGAHDQYGDNCEVCGATYEPTDLINPISTLTGATPVIRVSERMYFRLSGIQEELKNWIESDGVTDTSTRNKVLEWFDNELKDWDLSRDAPYFGFPIPDQPGKYFYVWLDAPIGYMASTQQWCDQNNVDFNTIWNLQSSSNEYEIYHFIGKDIANFHCVFWPALLHAANIRKPDAVFVHGFLTVNGKKMSKRDGTFIKLSDFCQHYDADLLRFYFASRLGPNPVDIDLNIAEFIEKVNTDLVSKLVNIPARLNGFIQGQMSGKLCDGFDIPIELKKQFNLEQADIAELLEQRQYSKATRKLMALVDAINGYIAQEKPWELAKYPGKAQQLFTSCSVAMTLFHAVVTWLSPFMPSTCSKLLNLYCVDAHSWIEAVQPLQGVTVKSYVPVLTRIDDSGFKALMKV